MLLYLLHITATMHHIGPLVIHWGGSPLHRIG